MSYACFEQDSLLISRLVNCSSNHHITPFLADTRIKRHCDAGTVPSVCKMHYFTLYAVSYYIVRLQDQYAQGFSSFKPDKKLRWLPHLGTVHLDLELQDRTISADVPPLEAAFIELFSDKGEPNP